MAKAVTTEDVKHVAALARLGISDDRAAALAADLTAILGHMAVLEKVDTSGIAEMATQPTPGMRLREDRGGSVPLSASLEGIAPQMRDGFFVVPRLASHEESESNG